jgi:hypothetical protein
VLNDIAMNADIPLRIAANPNTSRSILEDCDHFHCQDALLQVDSGSANPCIVVDDDANVSNVVFDGYQAWVGGTYGFYWNNTSSTIASHSLVFRNIRREQPTDAAAYSFYIAHTSSGQLQSLIIDGAYLSLSQKGIYLRKGVWVSLKSITYGSTSLEAFNADSTVQDLFLDNCQWQVGATATITGLVEVWSSHTGVGRPLPTNAHYLSGSEYANGGVKLGGTNTWAYTFTSVADLALVNLSVLNASATFKAAIITVAAYSATGPVSEGGVVLHTASGATILGASANFVLTNTAGKLCFLWAIPGQIRNRTGQTVDMVVTIAWV